MKIRCVNCGAEFKGRFRYCPRCGAPLPEESQTRGRSWVGLIVAVSIIVIAAMIGGTVWLVSLHDRDEAVRIAEKRLNDSLKVAEARAVRERNMRADSIRMAEAERLRAREMERMFVRVSDILSDNADGGLKPLSFDDVVEALRGRGYALLSRSDGDSPAVLGVNMTFDGGRLDAVAEPYSAVVVWPEMGRVEIRFCSDDACKEFRNAAFMAGVGDGDSDAACSLKSISSRVLMLENH